jgi:hypothetical protein
VLAYLFWHRPREPADSDAYEAAEVRFHRALARTRPAGLCGSAVFRLGSLPWEAPAAAATAYEDWYLVEDYAALGVLNGAAVGRGQRTAHDALARRFGLGSGGLYALLEGASGARHHAACSLAVWVTAAPQTRTPMLGELLGDGMDPAHATLWRRQLVLGPAPEFCLLTGEVSAGVAPTRLPEGWSARTLTRELIFSA